MKNIRPLEVYDIVRTPEQIGVIVEASTNLLCVVPSGEYSTETIWRKEDCKRVGRIAGINVGKYASIVNGKAQHGKTP